MMFPLPFEVTRIRRIHTNRVDSLGNDVVVDDSDERLVRVAGWAVRSADEPKLAGHDRRTVDVELFAPVGEFVHSDAVELPGRSQRFEVIGDPENYEHNPFGFSPGLEVVNLEVIE